MDGVIQLGPLMLATDRLLAIVLLWLFLTIGAWIGARTGSRAGRATWIAVMVGIVTARLGFVVENRAAFAVEPWSAIALWQGGFNLWVGVAGAAIAIVVLLGRQRATGGVLASLAVLALVHTGMGQWLAPPARPLPQGIILGHLDGRPLPLDTLRGKPFVLNLWASWCPPCRREMPMLIDVARTSQTPVLLVNHREAPVVIESFLKRQTLSASPVVYDPNGALADAIQARAFPTTLFVDSAGQIRTIHAGEISRATLIAGLRDLERNPK
jgi:thiol-disulfide isomerase/thioredoxin